MKKEFIFIKSLNLIIDKNDICHVGFVDPIDEELYGIISIARNDKTTIDYNSINIDLYEIAKKEIQSLLLNENT